MKPNDFDIQVLIDDLQGTCQTIEHFLPEGMEREDLTETDLETIDQEIFLCEQCGWWFEVSEQTEDGLCRDCKVMTMKMKKNRKGVWEGDVSTLPVMKAHCKTCPFKPNERGLWQDVELANEVISRTLFKAHQICHGTEEGKKRTPKNRCKGAYDHNMEIYERLGHGHLVK